MKIFGEGDCDTREKRLESLKYTLELGTVDAFTIGFSNTAQIDETLDLIEEAAVPKRQQTASALVDAAGRVLYHEDPILQQVQAGAQILLNASASPFF